MELYARVRRAVQIDQMSEREAARTFGLSRETVRKMLKFSVPPGYRRRAPIRRPKLEAYIAVIDQILALDKSIHRKQRHSVKRIFERLRDEHGYLGGYTVVKDYVREQKQRSKEMFVPLKHPPGHAQVDFGEADMYVNGVLERAHFFVMDLPHSDDGFVMAFPAETTEAFCEGHNQAFAYFGGVPQTILYDNTKLAVAQILGNGTRQKTRAFSELQSHYLFAERFGRPGKGNDKGFPGAPAAREQLCGAEPTSTNRMPEAAGEGITRAPGHNRKTLRMGSASTAAPACRSLRSM